ncbi:P-loop NTPase [Streptomyces griseoincarnatus]
MTRFIPVYGTKGGVGKSTIATNLAYAMQATGARVALIDLDITGPSVPDLVAGLHGTPPTMHNFRVLPGVFAGVEVSSVGFFTPPHEAPFLAGRYLHGALEQLLFHQSWADRDYVFIDLPPGFDELHRQVYTRLTTQTVLVTTPHVLAQHDLARGVHLLTQLEAAICGVVENMSHVSCRHCGALSPLFQGEPTLAPAALPTLARLPFSPEPPSPGGRAVPLFLSADPAAGEFQSTMARLVARLAESR